MELTVEHFRGSGYYQCYCKTYTTIKDIAHSENYKKELCYNYHYDIYIGFLLTQSVTILVTLTNIIIRTINIQLISFIGYQTKSEQVSMVMRSIFVDTLINTGIIVLMTNANFQDAPWPLNYIPIRGQFPDLNDNWYESIAP